MYCLAKWTHRSWQIPAERSAWKVILLPQPKGAPLNRTGPTLSRPIAMQPCLFMVAARLMTLLWPGQDSPTKHYPQLTEDDMPGILWCCLETSNCLLQSHSHVLQLKCSPLSGKSPTCASKTTPQRHHVPHMTQPTAPARARTQVARDSTRTRPMPEPSPHPRCPQDRATSARARRPEPPAVPHVCIPLLRLHDRHDHTHVLQLNHHSLNQQSTPATAGNAIHGGPQTNPCRLRPPTAKGPAAKTRYRQSKVAAHPSEASPRSPAETSTRREAETQNPATTQDHNQRAIQTCRHTTTPTRCQTQTQAQSRRHARSPRRMSSTTSSLCH